MLSGQDRKYVHPSRDGPHPPSCDKPPPSSLDDGDEVGLSFQDAFPQLADVLLDDQTRGVVASPLEQLAVESWEEEMVVVEDVM